VPGGTAFTGDQNFFYDNGFLAYEVLGVKQTSTLLITTAGWHLVAFSPSSGMFGVMPNFGTYQTFASPILTPELRSATVFGGGISYTTAYELADEF
jgi:hypothetical protein